MKKNTLISSLLLIGVFLLFAISCDKDDDNGKNRLKDKRDGKVYKTVKIGNQVWMAENLAYKPSSGNYWAYDNDDANVEIYGYLYDWHTVMNGATSSNSNPSNVQGICPSGWHVPSDAEWTELTDYLGGQSFAGGKLKSTGTIEAGTGLWYLGNTGATNETGFTALPGGIWWYDGTFYHIGIYGHWWSSTESSNEYSTISAWRRVMPCYDSYVDRDYHFKGNGLSVRCVRDN